MNPHFIVTYRDQGGLIDRCTVAATDAACAMRAFNWAEGRNCAISASPAPTHADDVALLAQLGIEV